MSNICVIHGDFKSSSFSASDEEISVVQWAADRFKEVGELRKLACVDVGF